MLGLILLAQDATQVAPFNWQTAMLAYGPLGAIVTFIGAMIYMFAPKIVDGHLTFLEKTAEQGEKMTEVMAQVADTLGEKMNPTGHQYRDHVFSNARTHKAMIHLADLLLAGSCEMSPKVADAVRPHVDAIKQAITGKEF